LRKKEKRMSIKESVKKFYFIRHYRIIAGILVVTVFVTMVLQSATLIAISRSDDRSEAAVNYLADNTEYVNKNSPQRVMDYLETLGSEHTLGDYYTLASTQIARAEYADALGNIEKCLSLYNNEGHELYVDLLMKRGCLQVMLGQYDAALKSLDAALAEAPGAADIYLVKAQIYAQRENMGALSQCLNAYLKLRPEDTAIRALLAQAQFTQGDYKAAAQQYAEILETSPDAKTEYLFGLNAVKNSDFAAAEASLTKAMAKDDNFDGIYYYRGVSRMSLGNYPGAIEDLTVSIEKEHMLQASYYTRGLCFLMDNQYERGLADIDAAANRNDDPEVTKLVEQLIAELQEVQSQDKAQTGEQALGAEKKAPAPLRPVEKTQNTGGTH
jgi:tetratricopeptide (TPR) repeat protein